MSIYGMRKRNVNYTLHQWRATAATTIGLPVTVPLVIATVMACMAPAIAQDVSKLCTPTPEYRAAKKVSKFLKSYRVAEDASKASKAAAKEYTVPAAEIHKDDSVHKAYVWTGKRHLHFGNLPGELQWYRVIEMAFVREGTKVGGLYDHFLVVNGKCLDPYSKIKSAGLADDCTIEMRVRLRGGMPDARNDAGAGGSNDPMPTASNVSMDDSSYARFFLDTNYVDSIPDEHGERRFFVIKCNEAKIGDVAYFEELRAAIADDRVIRALGLLVVASVLKSMLADSWL